MHTMQTITGAHISIGVEAVDFIGPRPRRLAVQLILWLLTKIDVRPVVRLDIDARLATGQVLQSLGRHTIPLGARTALGYGMDDEPAGAGATAAEAELKQAGKSFLDAVNAKGTG
jgi:hypothetical protein